MSNNNILLAILYYGLAFMGHHFAAAAIFVGLFLGVWFLVPVFAVFSLVTGISAYAIRRNK